MAATLARDELRPTLEGRIEADDACPGGARSRGRRSQDATVGSPLAAAVERLSGRRLWRSLAPTITPGPSFPSVARGASLIISTRPTAATGTSGPALTPDRGAVALLSQRDHRTRLRMALRAVVTGVIINLSELIRILSMQLFLAPAARLLPKSWAFALAEATSLLLMALPSPGMVTYWRMRRAFGRDRVCSFQLAWGWVARPFRDFVTLKRVLYGREDVARWRIIERYSEEVAGLRESGQSFIVATAHFERAALLGIACPRVTPGNLVTVGHPPPRKIRSLLNLRLRIQYGTMLKALSSAWRRRGEFAFTGSGQSAASLIYQRLREDGNIVSIHVDAPWPKGPTGSYSRPFAGLRKREFSTGAAQLAALTRRPIVSCTYWQQDDRTVVIEWGSPIRHVENETDTMNRLIDDLEAAIGQRPMQYLFDIGGMRRWNETRHRWEDLAV